MSPEMNNGNDTDGRSKQVRSLRELAQPVQPPRDLWPAISAEMTKAAPVATPVKRSPRLQWVAVAATVFALAVGIWIGRNVLPTGTVQSSPSVANNPTSREFVPAAYVSDPRYLKDRAELIRGLEARLKALPPKTQEQVAASLATIRKSMSDIQAALGRDPGNALLQELLVNTYQDEMRVLNAVHEANGGQEI
jgi:hypothetical protein